MSLDRHPLPFRTLLNLIGQSNCPEICHFVIYCPSILLNGRNRFVNVRLLYGTLGGRLNVVIHRDPLPFRQIHEVLPTPIVVLDRGWRELKETDSGLAFSIKSPYINHLLTTSFP